MSKEYTVEERLDALEKSLSSVISGLQAVARNTNTANERIMDLHWQGMADRGILFSLCKGAGMGQEDMERIVERTMAVWPEEDRWKRPPEIVVTVMEPGSMDDLPQEMVDALRGERDE